MGLLSPADLLIPLCPPAPPTSPTLAPPPLAQEAQSITDNATLPGQTDLAMLSQNSELPGMRGRAGEGRGGAAGRGEGVRGTKAQHDAAPDHRAVTVIVALAPDAAGVGQGAAGQGGTERGSEREGAAGQGAGGQEAAGQVTPALEQLPQAQPPPAPHPTQPQQPPQPSHVGLVAGTPFGMLHSGHSLQASHYLYSLLIYQSMLSHTARIKHQSPFDEATAIEYP